MAKDGMDDRVWKKLLKKLSRIDRHHVRVGILQSKGGGETADGGATMVDIGVIHEFGVPGANIPERSWLRGTFRKNQRKFGRITGQLAKLIVLNKKTVKQALEILGQWGASEVKKYITGGAHIPPPLKAATVKAKKSDRPLVDTGRLVQSISYDVEVR